MFDDYRPGLSVELLEFRAKKVHSSKDTVKSGDVFTNMQMTYICRYLPKTTLDLEMKCRLKDSQIRDYGEEIVRIVKKYCDLTQFEGEGGLRE